MTASTPDILTKILNRKREEIAECSRQISLSEMQQLAQCAEPVRGFVAAMRASLARGEVAVIAEVKKASPSRGLLREHFDAAEIARAYANAGATALSVLTDRDFFQGSAENLRRAKAACTLPVLRKDFILEEYQLYEARYMGADCVLLIVSALTQGQLTNLSQLACSLDLDVLVEVHDEKELQIALSLDTPLLGINNRNLRTFETCLDTTLDLLDFIPAHKIVVTESGIHQRADIERMREHGVNSFLVGEALVRASDPGQALRELFF
jgi:indole-3-glycerol phosphate synthase